MPKPTLTNSGFRLRAVALAASCGVLLVGCGGGSATQFMPDSGTTAEEQAAQMRATQQKAQLEEANKALTDALPPPLLDTEEKLNKANAAHKALVDAIEAARDVSDTDKEKYQRAADAAEDRIRDAQGAFDAKKTAEMQREEQQQMIKDAEDAAAMAATAMKLHTGIAPQTGSVTDVAAGTALNAGERAAAYNSTPAATAGTLIHVGIGIAAPAALSEDKDATVASLHGWTGKRYHRMMPNEGTYEAHVYSHVGEPTKGEKFNIQYTDLDETSGERPIDTSDEAVRALVASSRFDQSAGTKKFKLPDNMMRVVIPGSFHGVSGNYYCTVPAGGSCTATVAADGFTLSGVDSAGEAATVTWTFKPNNLEDTITDTPDNSYASYGWWIHTAANGDLTASAFVDRRGAAAAATGITALKGTATYNGGAVGKYALTSSTGGTNDAGHFTARATLQANFNDNMITGTIDSFMDGAGNEKDWSVELMKQTITAGGLINGTDGLGAGGASMTKWTIGDNAAAASGHWTGSLQENGADNVPGIATGTFYTHYGPSGKMVGAFGVNKEE